MDFNEILRKNISYGNTKSPKTLEISEKPQIDSPHPAF